MDALKKKTSEGTEDQVISHEILEEQLRLGRAPGNEVGQGRCTEELKSVERTIDKMSCVQCDLHHSAPLDL